MTPVKWVEIGAVTWLVAAVFALSRLDTDVPQGQSIRTTAPETTPAPSQSDEIRQHIVAVLENAATHGLNPADYKVEGDASLQNALERYLGDLRDGRSNPWLYRKADSAEPVAEAAAQILAANSIADVNSLLERQEPPYDGYRQTVKALATYRELAMHDTGELLPAVTKTIDSGAAYAGAATLAARLRLEGDLAADAVVSEGVYSESLAAGVKHFQTRHGLEADGRLGKGTLAQLNTPLSERVKQLEDTLERWRWLPRGYDSRMVLVNIPEFKLRALDATHRLELEMRVVTGLPSWQTPLMADQIEYLIFNPSWNVPLSIQKKELVADVAKDPEYLKKHGYEVVSPKGQIAEGEFSEETLDRLKSGNLMLRQTPGPQNALGKVKFLFPNEHDVYLHDTPSKSYFNRARRALSHGCIRVQHPEELAKWLLHDREDWPADRISEALKGSKQMQVNLKEPVPVFLIYHTTAVENGEVFFFDDVYKLTRS